MTVRRLHLRPGRLERSLTRDLARGAPTALFQAANGLGLLCDARVLLTAGALWLFIDRSAHSRGSGKRFFSTIGVTTVLHHSIKRVIAQRRPDRIFPRRDGRNTGRPFDAMPSGHAMHAGAIASFAGGGAGVWVTTGALAVARVLNLAHWPSGVLVGFLLGVASERGVRLVLGCPTARSRVTAAEPWDS